MNADLYVVLRVFEVNVVKLLDASLITKFAVFYPDFFDKLGLEALEHKVETVRRLQGVG